MTAMQMAASAWISSSARPEADACLAMVRASAVRTLVYLATKKSWAG